MQQSQKLTSAQHPINASPPIEKHDAKKTHMFSFHRAAAQRATACLSQLGSRHQHGCGPNASSCFRIAAKCSSDRRAQHLGDGEYAPDNQCYLWSLEMSSPLGPSEKGTRTGPRDRLVQQKTILANVLQRILLSRLGYIARVPRYQAQQVPGHIYKARRDCITK